MKKILLLTFIATSFFGSVEARKIYSKGSGNWQTAGTWVGDVVPIAGDTVIIQNSHTVAVSNNLYSNSTYMFLIILGTLDLTNNGKMSFSASSNVIIETGGSILGNNNADQISIGTGGAEYSGGSGNVTGPSYINNGHTPVSGEGTAGCGCYTSVGSCSITSTDGYTVHISVVATSIAVETSPCTFGYNYDVNLSYNITFSGTNIPASLNTLQGTIYCGTSALFFDLPNSGGSGTVQSGGNAWRPVADCATATPTSLNCLNATIQIGGSGIAANTTCTSTLPIKLLNFEVDPTPEGAMLLWTTSMEKDFDYFQLERASENLSFSPVTRVEGKGALDVNTTYTYLDKLVKSGKNYYRLKSVDLDGQFEYSRVLFLNWRTGDGIRIYPNPLTDHNFTIELNDQISTPTRITLSDQLGQVVYESELVNPTTEVQLPDSFKPGIYFLRVSSGPQQEMIKVLIQ